MGICRTSWIGFLIITLLLVFPGAASSQALSEEGKRFWEEYQKLRDLGDNKETVRFVSRYKDQAGEVFDVGINSLARGEVGGSEVEHLKALSGHLSSLLRSQKYDYQFSLIYQFTPEKGREWVKARDEYFFGRQALLEGKESKNLYKLDEALTLLKKAFAAFENLGDNLSLCELAIDLAQTHEVLEDKYEACVTYHKSLEAMKKLPFPHQQLKGLEAANEKYLGEGYDPTKPRDQGGPAPKEETGEVVTPDGKVLEEPEFELSDKSENIALKYTGMKNSAEFFTPAFNTGYNRFLWPTYWFNAASGDQSAHFNPSYLRCLYAVTFYQKQINIQRKGAKFYLDINAQEETRKLVKASSKPTKLELSEKGKDGKTHKYQFFLQAPGQAENMFGMELNNAPDEMGVVNLRCRTGCYTKGKVGKENFILIDDNSNGTFGDYYAMATDCLIHGEYRYWRTDAVLYGREKTARPFSQYMKLGDKWYYLSVDMYGEKLTVTEATVETGTVKLDWRGSKAPAYLVLHLLDETVNGVFINVAESKDPVELPVGEYEIASGKIEESKKGQARQVRIYNGAADTIRVFAGEETVLELGAPFKFSFVASSLGKEYRVKGNTLNVWGRGKELYAQFFDNIPQPTVSIRDKESGSIMKKGQKMVMANREDFFKDYRCVWFPMDYVYENKKGAKLESRLEAKSIKLLGGPVASDWK